MRPVIEEMNNNEVFGGIMIVLTVFGIIYIIQIVIALLKNIFRLYFVRFVVLYLPNRNIKKKILGINNNLNMHVNKYMESFWNAFYTDENNEMINALEENVKHCSHADRYCKYELFCPLCSSIEHDTI